MGRRVSRWTRHGGGWCERAVDALDLEIKRVHALHAIACGLARLKWLAAATRFEIALRRHARALKYGYNPNQPRVPAGSREGGQWTSDDAGGGSSTARITAEPTAGSGRGDWRVLSDITPDNVRKPRTQLAANEGQVFDPIRLEDEEAKGGHAIEYHVNRSEEALKAQALAQFDLNPNVTDVRSGSFSSPAAANKLVNSTLARNQAIVDGVASGVIERTVVIGEFNSITGIEAVAPNARSEPYIRETYNVGVVIAHDPYASRGYRIITAFPTNRNKP